MADGDYERRDARLAEIKRLEGLLRASKASNGWDGSDVPARLCAGRDLVEEMAGIDRG